MHLRMTDLCDWLGVPPHKVKYWMYFKGFPYAISRSRSKFSMPDVKKWLEKHPYVYVDIVPLFDIKWREREAEAERRTQHVMQLKQNQTSSSNVTRRRRRSARR